MLAPIIGESEKERRSLIGLGLGPDTTAVAMDDPLHNRQANAGSLILFGEMESLKHAEQFVDIAHVKANAIVFDEIQGMTR
jgi:hypothetical protein